MPLPPSIAVRIAQIVTQLAQTAFRGGTLIRKVDKFRVGDYLVEVVRRATLGRDEGISQMVHVFKNGKRVDVRHLVVKLGRVIHRDLKKIRVKK